MPDARNDRLPSLPPVEGSVWEMAQALALQTGKPAMLVTLSWGRRVAAIRKADGSIRQRELDAAESSALGKPPWASMVSGGLDTTVGTIWYIFDFLPYSVTYGISP